MVSTAKQASTDLSRTLIGQSSAMQAVRDLILRIAPTESSCLITGPSGSGKEVVAGALHDLSSRRVAAFEAMNCGAVPLDLIESEMFGHQKGAFTGAIGAREGRFERANGGTLFLDEIGDMPFDMQVKLLRVLETRRFEKVGGGKTQIADVRVIAATHCHLEDAITDGKFREDLFYRLNVLPIALPCLSQRREDVEELIQHFAGGRKNARFRPTSAAIALLGNYDWPGNVRELRNFCERAAVLHAGKTISDGEAHFLLSLGRAHSIASNNSAAAHIPQPPVTTAAAAPVAAVPRAVSASAGPSNIVPLLRPSGPPAPTSSAVDLLGETGVDLRTVLADLEQSYIASALTRSEYVIADAARLLGLQRTTLCEKMRRYDIARDAQQNGNAATG